MFKLNDIIPAFPESFVREHNDRNKGFNKAKVIYIHPEGRYYTLEFSYPGGSFCESRYFTFKELEVGRREGIFNQERVAKVYNACPPGFIMAGFEGDEDVFVGGYNEAKQRTAAAFDEFDAALF